MATLAYSPIHYSMSSPSSSPSSLRPSFAFAQIGDEIALVQLSQPFSSLLVSDIRVYRHEFLTIYRYSHNATVHPSDIHVLKRLDDLCTIGEDIPETITLPREIVSRFEGLSNNMKFQRMTTQSYRRTQSTSAYRTSATQIR
ncbi:hypothetical protein QCA50_011820 [Cerrena zonata]|uniref:Uncharacterized protein n=1 Tax=Cerrena zonata TaxID=2478898 RepID=A0AAW0G7L1_9APHY